MAAGMTTTMELTQCFYARLYMLVSVPAPLHDLDPNNYWDVRDAILSL